MSLNRHGYRTKELKASETRPAQCSWCKRPFTQSSAILEDAKGERIVWLPVFCPPCTRRTLKQLGPLK